MLKSDRVPVPANRSVCLPMPLPESEPIIAAMSQNLLRKFGNFYELEEGLPEVLQAMCTDPVEFEAGSVIAEQGAAYNGVFLIENGWVFRSKSLENGSRQIVNVAIAGDFIGLNALLFAESDFNLIAKTHVEAYRFETQKLAEILSRYPAFGAALFWVNTQEESILAERIVSLGRRTARQRTAHVLCEFISRMEIFGIDDPTQMLLPISQSEFADMLGISLVHMNKTLRRLETEEIVIFRNELLQIENMKALERIAGFDSGYLHFTHRIDRVSRKGKPIGDMKIIHP